MGSLSNKRETVTASGLTIDRALFDFVNDQAIPGTGVDPEKFWQGFADIIKQFAPRNRQLLAQRDKLQAQIDDWHIKRRGETHDAAAYKQFLIDIGYLVEPGPAFEISSENVDPEIAALAGPQLVVPVMNARFALNACNARWGSLYDALYGTDAISTSNGAEMTQGYNPIRGANVMARGREFLDRHFPLVESSYKDIQSLSVEGQDLLAKLKGGESVALLRPEQFVGYRGKAKNPALILLKNNGLHIEIVIDPNSRIGASDPAGIKDLVLESALTTIMDCEDSVAAVDAEDKMLVYKNWLGLMQATLEEEVSKGGKTFVRRMQGDREYCSPTGETFSLPGRSLMFVRNVGHLMTTPAILDGEGREIPEGIMDGMITSLAAIHDLKQTGSLQNSRSGSVYIVKPKMHGPQEVAFTDELFGAIEEVLGLPKATLKVGIMDEERRTSVNLIECIRAAKERVVFINTGFLDRTGDEIHTSIEAGAFACKAKIKVMPWIEAYEQSNVAAGLQCGLQGKAQIGKGMWAMPDNMADMLKAKVSQPMAGATTAWVPSPTAATLHVMHYHEVNVAAVQEQLKATAKVDVDTILAIPLLKNESLDAGQIETELQNNAQGILGYVVRWIDQGIGCSKVPDINNIAMMEDRATLRISSQHICNWLYHNICSVEQVVEVMQKMAAVVDKQNSHDPLYQAMAPNFDDSIAFAAAMALIMEGKQQPNGYTEPLLHAFRQQLKDKTA